MTIVAIVVLMAISGPLSLAAPTVKVVSPANGTVLTTHDVNVTGTTTAVDGSWTQASFSAFDGGQKDQVFVNSSGRVILAGKMWDDYNDNSLNSSKWTVTSKVNLDATEQNGELHLSGKSASGTNWGAKVWVESNNDCSNMLQATMTITGSGGYTSGIFLWKDSYNYIGIGATYSDATGNKLVLVATSMSGGVNHYDSHGVLSPTAHTLKITLDGSKARLYLDNSLFDTISNTLTSAPVRITANALYNGDTVDAEWDDVVSQFDSPGNLTSSVYDSHCSSLDLKRVDWTSSEPTGTDLSVQIRSSNSSDMSSPTPWTAVTEGQTSAFPVAYRYLQYIAHLTTNTIHETPSLNDITFVYRRPVTGVEVSINEGLTWTNATGIASWYAELVLPENRTRVYIRATDISGERTTTYTTVDVDTTPPVGVVVIDGGLGIAPDQDVTLSFVATDRYGVTEVMVDDSMDFPDGYWRPYVDSLPWHLPWGDGTKTVYAKFKDSNGWESTIVSDSIMLDTFPPVGSIFIDGGAEYTNRRLVTLSIDATDLTGVPDMRMGEASDLSGVGWRPFASTLAFELSRGDGEKNVYVSFRDPLGHVSAPVRATIILDTTPPVLDITINGGATYTNRTDVQVGVVPTEQFRTTFIQMGDEPDLSQAEMWAFASSMGWTFGPGDGAKAIYARAWDAAGNVGPASMDNIVLDTVPPLASIAINGGAGHTNARMVSVVLTVIDDFMVTHMQLGEEPTLTGIATMPLTARLQWALSDGDGPKTLYVRTVDAAGNIGETTSAGITLDTTPPVLKISVIDDTLYTSRRGVELILEATDASPISRMQLCEDPDLTGSMVVPFAPTTLFTLSASDGQKTIHGRIWDAAGNVGTVTSVPVVLDTTPPTLKVEVGSPFTASRTVSIQLDATDDWGIKDVQLGNDPTLQGSAFVPYSHVMDLTLTGAEGTLGVFGRARDLAGNLGPIVSDQTILDTKPPTAEILTTFTLPGSPLIYVTWAGTDEISGVRSFDVQCRDSDGPWTDWLLGTFRTEGAYEGEDGHTYSFRVRAFDLAGNMGEYPGTVQNTVRVSIPPPPLPEVVVTTPLADAKVSGIVYVSGTALSRNDSRSIVWVKVSWEGSPWNDATGTVMWSLAIDTTLMEDGQQTIRVRAFDGQGYSEEVSRDIIVKNPSTEEPGEFIGSVGFYIILLLVIAVAGASTTYIIWRGKRQE